MTIMPIEGLGGYSRVAAALTEHYRAVPPVDRRQVEIWFRRRTLNAAGTPFPDPAERLPPGRRLAPRMLFDIRTVLAWAEPGVPRPHADGYWTLADRTAWYRDNPQASTRVDKRRAGHYAKG